jgi:hypothetical protein
MVIKAAGEKPDGFEIKINFILLYLFYSGNSRFFYLMMDKDSSL